LWQAGAVAAWAGGRSRAAGAAEPSGRLATVPASGPASAPDAASAEPASYLSEIIPSLEAPWPRNRTVNVVCHGHSVPAGYFNTPAVETFNAYPHLLHRGLKDRFPHAVINVIVTAIGGEHSEAGAARFERDALTHQPAVVTIDYALNDRRIGLEKAAAAWSRMIELATARGVKVILLTPTPDTTARLDSPADPLLRHAGQVRELARRYGVGLADSLAAFQKRIAAGTDLAGLMSQFNHPNRRGHELVAAELLRWFPSSSG
jgi:lysophospholipase L1-like esterase